MSSKYSFGIGDELKTTFENQLIVGTNNEYPASKARIIIGNGESGDPVGLSTLIIYDDGTIETLGELKLALDTSATSGVDKELTDAISGLGWTSDVIE